MYVIKYENQGIHLYKDDKWILSNNGSPEEIISTRDVIEIMLKHLGFEYTIIY